MAKVIGEGTYGCIHEPSLKCAPGTKVSYENKVSKVLSVKNAKTEISEYKKVAKADKKNEFYLGKPIKCNLDNSQYNLTAIAQCQIGYDVLRDLKGYDLIVMNNGGDNLENYSNKIRGWSKSDASTEKCEKFLLEILRLFAGLKTFKNNDLVHYDLKPQNIVYNETENRLNYIDFGLMGSIKKILNKCKESKYEWSHFHWSYPWENEILNKQDFIYIKSGWYNPIDDIKRELRAGVGRHFKQIKDFCFYSFSSYGDAEYRQLFNDNIANYEGTIDEDMNQMDYDEFLKKSIETVDIYGLGIALNWWFNKAKKHIEEQHLGFLSTFFRSLISARLLTRPTVEKALDDYENFIISSHLLAKHGKEIKDHIVVDAKIASNSSSKTPALIIEKSYRPDPNDVNNTPLNPCPEGKEINPKTRRCVKKCPDGKIKNPSGRCVKNKTRKAASACPEDKELNPRTGRCVKKCKPGYERNNQFKCTRSKK